MPTYDFCNHVILIESSNSRYLYGAAQNEDSNYKSRSISMKGSIHYTDSKKLDSRLPVECDLSEMHYNEPTACIGSMDMRKDRLQIFAFMPPDGISFILQMLAVSDQGVIYVTGFELRYRKATIRELYLDTEFRVEDY